MKTAASTDHSPELPSLDVLKASQLEGRWKCVDIEGNFQEFMKAMGQGWMKRKMAATFGFGKGKMRQTISFDEAGKMNMKIKMGPLNNTDMIDFDGKLRKKTLPFSEAECSATFSEGAITFKVPSKNFVARRYVGEDGKMRNEFTCGDVKASRTFERIEE